MRSRSSSLRSASRSAALRARPIKEEADPVKPYKANPHKHKFLVRIAECGDISVWQHIEQRVFEEANNLTPQDTDDYVTELSEQQLFDALFEYCN